MSILIDGTSGITPLAFSSNLQFTSTGQRITGDFSNATQSNRVLFQTSTTNSATNVGVIPSGSGTTSVLDVRNSSNADNCSMLRMTATASDTRLVSTINGTGTYLPILFLTNGSEQMRIDTSGNVGIGTSSPSNKLDISIDSNGQGWVGLRNINAGSSATTGILFGNNDNAAYGAIFLGSSTYNSFGGANSLNIGSYGAVPFTLFTSATERMRIDSDGNVGIGTSSPSSYAKFVAVGPTSSAGSTSIVGNFRSSAADTSTYYNGTKLAIQNSNSTSGTMSYLGFVSANGNDYASIVGSCTTHTFAAAVGYLAFGTNNGSGATTERMRITSGGEVYIAGTTDQGAYNLQCNGTGVWGAGAYVNGSDQRLKENITALDNSLGLVNAMRPVTFTYKEDYSKDRAVQPGFIAQELQEVLSGKDYLDGIVQAGSEYLNVAYQNLIPLLVKAIQELTARVEELESK